MTVVDLRAETRAFSRARLRELALDTAREVVLDRGWSAVRMGSIAKSVGISRQSLHAEFGTKDDLGTALVERETSIFFDGVQARLALHPGDLFSAVEDASHYILDVAQDNPLLQTILTRAPDHGDLSLLPLITTRGNPLINRGMAVFGGWVSAQWPSLAAADSQLMVESVVRLSLSHIVMPTMPTADAARDLARVACRCLGFPDTHA